MSNGIYTFLFILVIIVIIIVLFVASSGGISGGGGGGGGGTVVVSSISPDYTIVGYGSSTTTPVTITGSGFNYGNGAIVFLYYPYSTSYFFLSDVVVVNNKTITCTIPYIKESFNAIPYGIQVQTYIYEKIDNVGKVTDQKYSNILENAFTFYYTNSPILNSISPSSATIGQGVSTSIAVYGSNFTSMSASNLEVRFTYPTNISSTAYTSSSATVVDDSTITATVPYNSSASSSDVPYGVYLYFGSTPYSNILIDGFTQYAPTTPTITDITPSSGTLDRNANGSTIPITITGTGFYEQIQIKLVSTYPQLIGNVYETGYATNILIISSTSLTAEVPYIVSTENGDTYNVTIITGTSGYELTSNVFIEGFTEYYTGYPVITSIYPSSGYQYETITLTGYNFSNLDQNSSYSVKFYDVTNYPPTYYKGTNPLIVSDTTATVTVPNLKYSGVSFAVELRGDKPSNLVYNGFTYEGTLPFSITSISPSSATVDYGETVSLEITGTGFYSNTDIQITAIGIYPSDDNYTYPVISCTDVVFVSSTTLTATFPFEFSSSINNGNTFNITVSASNGSSTLVNGFTQYYTGYPVILSITPTSGVADDTITITGYNFSNINLSFTYIMDFFDTSTIPWTYYTSNITILSDTTATVVVPDLTYPINYILGINGSPPSNFYSSFTCLELTYLHMKSITPNYGTVTKGSNETTTITIKGSGFSNVIQIKGAAIYPSEMVNYNFVYDTAYCTNINVISSTLLTASFPTVNSTFNNGNVYNITIIKDTETSNSLTFTQYYTGYPVISGVYPTSGTTGDTITITGYNFSNIDITSGYSSIYFISADYNYIYPADLYIISDTTATCTVPVIDEQNIYSLEMSSNPYPSNLFANSFTYY